MAEHKKRIDFVSLKIVKEHSITIENRSIDNPNIAYNLIKNYAGDADREQLYIICVNTKNEPTHISLISMGTLNSSLVHPREVFKLAILSNSASIILVHNHPSGKLEPSKEDLNITQRIKKCGEMLGIKLIDHLIISEKHFLSFKDKNIL